MTQNRLQRIENGLKETFNPEFLEVLDESHKHAGHAGASPLGETHYHVRIIALDFKGKTRVAVHRAINEVLKNEFNTGLHALSIDSKAS